jgi:hypothetical protein
MTQGQILGMEIRTFYHIVGGVPSSINEEGATRTVRAIIFRSKNKRTTFKGKWNSRG